MPVGCGDDDITHLERAVIERRRAAITDRDHDADVLVALDDRERCRRGVIGAGVLLRLSSERVLVRATDARREHLDQDGPGLQPVGIREALELEPSRCDERRREHVRGIAES